MMKKKHGDGERGYWLRLILLLVGIAGVGAVIWFTCWKFLPQMVETPEVKVSNFTQNGSVYIEAPTNRSKY